MWIGDGGGRRLCSHRPGSEGEDKENRTCDPRKIIVAPLRGADGAARHPYPKTGELGHDSNLSNLTTS